MVMPEKHWCEVCREEYGQPVYCAPKRCYCGHSECPAYEHYIPRDKIPVPVINLTPGHNKWKRKK